MTNKKYQNNYAAGRPQMYDEASRVKKAHNIVKILKDYFKRKQLKTLTLLDVGASTGIIDNELSNYFKKVVGTDIDKKAINFANKNFKKRNLIFQVEDAMKLTFKNNTFDVVICTHVYEHVPNQEQLFSEIYRVLKKGGVCYLAAQNRLWPWEPHHNLWFLSWLPKPLANKYIQIARHKNEYYESPKTYWGIKSLTKQFRQTDFTPKILSNPKRYGFSNPSVGSIGKYITFFMPTNFWLLRK